MAEVLNDLERKCLRIAHFLKRKECIRIAGLLKNANWNRVVACGLKMGCFFTHECFQTNIDMGWHILKKF